MKNTRVCPKCGHNQILLIDTVPDTGEYPNEIRRLHVARAVIGRTLFGGDRFGAVGKLSAAVCRRCRS